MQKVESQMLLAVYYCYLRLPCEGCPFSAEQRSPDSRTEVQVLHARDGDWHPVTQWLQTCVEDLCHSFPSVWHPGSCASW